MLRAEYVGTADDCQTDKQQVVEYGFSTSQHVLITYHLSIAKGACQDGISDKMLTCDKPTCPQEEQFNLKLNLYDYQKNLFLNPPLREGNID